MSSPPESNIILDPATELRSALSSHAFGLDPASTVISAGPSAGPTGQAGVAAVPASGILPSDAAINTVGRARVVLLDGEGEMVVNLSGKGYEVESWSLPQPVPRSSFESLDGLLIAVSPAYVAAMQEEVMKRFAR